ncbi:hypothetical protein D3C72_1155960 [compost metagenome]
MYAGQQAPPLRGKLLGHALQMRKLLGMAQQVIRAHGKGLGRYEMQQLAACSVTLPGMPGGEKIQAKAKSGFQNAPLRLARPGGGQPHASQKNLFGLLHRMRGLAAVAVAKARAVGRAIFHPLHGLAHGLLGFLVKNMSIVGSWGIRHAHISLA